MQIVEVPFQLSEDDLQGTGGPRSEGLHQSDLIKSICKTMDPKRFDRGDDLPWDLFALGFAWEKSLGRSFSELSAVNMHPGEFTLDGIYLSPDGYNKEYDCLEEFKATYMSSRGCDIGHDKFWHWRVQAMGYCKAMGLLECIFRVYFVCADYTWPMQPEWKSWIVAFSQQEIDQNWSMLIRHAQEKGWL
jgi:hypothetical protein